eukprot:3986510-Alexandrium_andersonii.AAC.1
MAKKDNRRGFQGPRRQNKPGGKGRAEWQGRNWQSGRARSCGSGDWDQQGQWPRQWQPDSRGWGSQGWSWPEEPP